MILSLAQLSILLGCIGSSDAIFGRKHEACFGVLGCFSNRAPFNNAWDDLPDPPRQIALQLFLQTRRNPTHAQKINYMKPNYVRATNFDSRKPIAFVIHGYDSYYNQTEFLNLTTGLLRKDDINVIGVDWRKGADTSYPKAVANTRMVGAQVAYFISQLEKYHHTSRSRVHVIGHSLGAQVAGYIGKRLPGLGRITGLDPAGPLYTGQDKAVRLNSADAVFVDVIHTDAAPLIDMGFGTSDLVGDIDFFPNGGMHQVGCPPPQSTGIEDMLTGQFSKVFHAVACSHERAVYLFTSSLFDDACAFQAYPCSSWAHFRSGICGNCGSSDCPLMGYDAINSQARGVFYLETNGSPPYCKTK